MYISQLMLDDKQSQNLVAYNHKYLFIVHSFVCQFQFNFFKLWLKVELESPSCIFLLGLGLQSNSYPAEALFMAIGRSTGGKLNHTDTF